jgi:hypothetical protein
VADCQSCAPKRHTECPAKAVSETARRRAGVSGMAHCREHRTQRQNDGRRDRGRSAGTSGALACGNQARRQAMRATPRTGVGQSG